MSFRPRGKTSIFVMSRRRGAPYTDQLADNDQNLIYQGHDVRRSPGGPRPDETDQPLLQEDGKKLSDNAKFLQVAEATKRGARPEPIHVWEKIVTGVWIYKGIFELVDAWEESDGRRRVFRFKLRFKTEQTPGSDPIVHTRLIPSDVKAEVWRRDGGRCVACGATDNLHFDHDLPFSKGGTSLSASNIKILCMRHNLAKGDKIL